MYKASKTPRLYRDLHTCTTRNELSSYYTIYVCFHVCSLHCPVSSLMRSDILRNIDVLGRECLWSLERKVSQHACHGLVSALVIRPVLLCSVIWRFVLSAARICNHQFYCISHEVFCKIIISIIIIVIIKEKLACSRT